MIKKKTQINFKNLKFYYGIPHAHCGFSTGRGTPTEAFDYARHNGLDFLILTDHNNYLIKSVRMNGNELSKWEALKYLRTKYRKKHDNFLPVIGFESKTSGFGDINIINSNRFFTGIVSNLKLLILWMFNNPNAFITLNHPHKNINYLEYSPLLNKLITSIEVGNGSAPNKYSRYDKYYYNLLDKGWQLGAINSQDNHRMNFGDDENLTCIISNELTLDSLITAFRSRHTYSTESKSLVMYFTINNAFMGETIPLDDNELEFYIFIQDNNYKIKEIDIISYSGTVIKKIPDLNLNRIKYIYRHKAETNEKWYVIKTILENGKVGISSPIFRV
ncbi:histidinol phosphatase [Clostridium botulinum]|uniref:Histidinol phosphatase n=1 Tax=Clostridium botulinum TaxID=1491 RepID=A0A0L9Y605_CLOBO|nr:histidinol-phosphatase [Clostridium botulinum]KAI3349440.1 histidinol phosphatase [Clostridium botulinum]KOM87038.1 PHP family phosphohydrolase, histidinol phosphatase [Clostridium botulinum]KOR60685.1 histidinol phosphatase [Clostridium botulinum]MBN1042705.1 histidinol phosphatase [Clostridium botulinum]MBN1074950.1 histidinol phosphatase [Clostridium botulinum]